MQVADLNAVAPGVTEVAPKVGMERQSIFLGEFVPDLIDLLLVAHHDAEMFDTVGMQLLDLKDGKKLMFAQLAPHRPFAAAKHFQTEDVLIEGGGLFRVINFDSNMINPIDLDGHNTDPFSPHRFADHSAFVLEAALDITTCRSQSAITDGGWAPDKPDCPST